MRCSDFHQRMNALLDERQDPAKDVLVQLHAQSCDNCCRDLQSYQVMLGAYKQPSKQSGEKRSAQVVTKLRPASHLMRARFWPIVAATVLVATGLLMLPDAPTSTVAVVDVVEEPQQPEVVATPPIVVTNRDPRPGGNFVQPIWGLTLVANADWSGLESVEMPFGVQVPALETDWIQGVADEMVPIKQSVDSTVALIVRTLST